MAGLRVSGSSCGVGSSSSWGATLESLGKEAGLPHMSWHHLKNNTGSYLIVQHVPITSVSKILGRKNVATTLRVYAHGLLEKTDSEYVHWGVSEHWSMRKIPGDCTT